ncbi:MAG: hypothetical protein ABFS03_00755 [Chloroflexota bacterium]
MSEYNPREEALRIADIIPMSEDAIELIQNKLEIAFIQGKLAYNEDMKKWRVESEQK